MRAGVVSNTIAHFYTVLPIFGYCAVYGYYNCMML